MRVETELDPPDIWQREDGTWRARLLGAPVGGSGPTVESAAGELVVHLRRWAKDWHSGRSAVASSLQFGDELSRFVIDTDDDALSSWVLESAVS